MKVVVFALLVLALCVSCAVSDGLPWLSQAYYANFHATNALSKDYTIGVNASIVSDGYNGNNALRVSLAKPASGKPAPSIMTRWNIMNTTLVAGTVLKVTTILKAEVSNTVTQYLNGIKIQLYVHTNSTPQYGNADNVTGTFDWSTTAFSYQLQISTTASAVDLQIGFQECYGTFWLDSINISVWRPAPQVNPPAVYDGHPDIPRLRGVMSPTTFIDSDISNLGLSWGANVMRWQIFGINYNVITNLALYDQWLEAKLNETDKALEACYKYKIKCIVDLHALPPAEGTLYCNGSSILCSLDTQTYFLQKWEQMATRFKGRNGVWGYDLANEPVQYSYSSNPAVLDWQSLVQATVDIIRKIDTEVTIIMESIQQANPRQFMNLSPINDNKTVYSLHMYDPSPYSMQGVYFPYPGDTWPSDGSGKTTLVYYLQYARAFQLAFNVQIYVGEFSAVRWASGAVYYLRDCIELFELWGWDWTYHAYREYQGWSVEYDEDKNSTSPVTYNTTRKNLLISYFQTNIRPTNDDDTPTSAPSTTTSSSSSSSSSSPTSTSSSSPSSTTSTPAPISSVATQTVISGLVVLVALALFI